MKKKDLFKPESLMMSYAYEPQLSEGALKCPIFQTSTFVFKSAEEGKAFFELATGMREPQKGEQLGLIYSRLNNPDLEILENRLCLWDEAEKAAVFESGMSAISTCMLEFLHPGDLLLFSNPVYGGTDHFVNHVLVKFGIHVLGFHAGMSEEELEELIESSGKADRLAMIFMETPANPTNDLIDIEACSHLAAKYSTEDKKVIVAVDNTYLGPIFQHPLKHGADLVLYSATKYIGGHSDVIAGAVLGSAELMNRVIALRTYLGNMAGPWTGWLLMRSLETLKIRMEQQVVNARHVAEFLKDHPKVKHLNYLGFIDPENTRQRLIYEKQCLTPGAMLSFTLEGGEAEAFTFLNKLKLIKLAVSLGSTESLAEHPASMTHAGVAPEHKLKYGVLDNLVRISIGVENKDDIIWDIKQALEAVPTASKAEMAALAE
jgi:methionine-gamma-lyase